MDPSEAQKLTDKPKAGRKTARKVRGFSEKQTVSYMLKIFRNASVLLMYRMTVCMCKGKFYNMCTYQNVLPREICKTSQGKEHFLPFAFIKQSDCSYFFKKFIYFQLKANCFTVLHWFLPNISMNQSQVYPCSFLPASPSHPSRLLLSPGLSSLSHTANSHWLYI